MPSGDSNPKTIVDVGVPAYRRADFIGEAIESVLAQSFEHWQLIVFDNGPGGGAIERAAQQYLSDPRVSYVATGRDLTLAENWSNAIRYGSAPYVAILNDDDRWHADFLAARVEALDAHPECGFAFSEWVEIDERSVVTGRSRTRFAEGVLPRALLARVLARRNVIVPPAILVRRSAYEAVGPAFDGSWHYCDWEMWARLAARFPAYYLARQDNDFRRHSTANTFTNREQPAQLVALVDHLRRLFASEGEDVAPTRLQQARNRSYVLVNAAGDVHMKGGWKASRRLYRRGLREYPPAVFERRSLQLLAHTLLGRRLSRATAQAARSLAAPLVTRRADRA